MSDELPSSSRATTLAVICLLAVALLAVVSHLPAGFAARVAQALALPGTANANAGAQSDPDKALPPPGPPPYSEFIACTRKNTHVNNQARVGSFVINTNVWNPTAADFFEACVKARHHTATDRIDADLTWDVKKNRHEVLSFPNLSHGWQVGTTNGSTSTRLPVMAGNMPDLRVSAQVNTTCDDAAAGDTRSDIKPHIDKKPQKSACVMNTAFELLFSDAMQPTTWPPKSEIMVWVQATCHHCNAGKLVDTRFIDGIEWEVYKGMVKPPVDVHEWTYVAYVAKQTVKAVDLNFKPFVQDAIARGYIKPNEYLAVLELGTEIIAGKGRTEVRDLQIR